VKRVRGPVTGRLSFPQRKKAQASRQKFYTPHDYRLGNSFYGEIMEAFWRSKTSPNAPECGADRCNAATPRPAYT
jgi:hypothetical protein